MQFLVFAAALLQIAHQCNAIATIQANTTSLAATGTTTTTTTAAQPKGTSSAGPTKTGISPAMAAALAEMLAKEGAGTAGGGGENLMGALTTLLGKGGRSGEGLAGQFQPAAAPRPFMPNGYRPRPPKPSVYANFDERPTGTGPSSAYECWNSHIDYRNSSISFEKTQHSPTYTTRTISTMILDTIFNNQSAQYTTKLCDGVTRIMGSETATRVALTFDETRVETAAVHPSITPASCTVRDPVCKDLYSVFDKSTFSFLSKTLFKFFTEATAGDLPLLEFNHLAPPCRRPEKCMPQTEIQYCKLKAHGATVFYWPEATPTPGSSPATVKDICHRNPLTIPTPAVQANPAPTATFKTHTVTSPTPLVILRSIYAEVLGTDAFNTIFPDYATLAGARNGVPEFLMPRLPPNYFQSCGPMLDATMQLAPQEFSTYRSSFYPTRIYPPRGTSILPVTLYHATSTKVPFDFGDLYPADSAPWDAIAGSAGCNTLALTQWRERQSAAKSISSEKAKSSSLSLKSNSTRIISNSTITKTAAGSLARRTAPPPPPVSLITIYEGNDDGYRMATRIPPVQCPETIDGRQYVPIMELPKAATKIASEYEICDPDVLHGAQFVPITTTSIGLPVRTKWGAKVPPPAKTQSIETFEILRFLTSEIAEPTAEADPFANLSLQPQVEPASIGDM